MHLCVFLVLKSDKIKLIKQRDDRVKKNNEILKLQKTKQNKTKQRTYRCCTCYCCRYAWRLVGGVGSGVDGGGGSFQRNFSARGGSFSSFFFSDKAGSDFARSCELRGNHEWISTPQCRQITNSLKVHNITKVEWLIQWPR